MVIGLAGLGTPGAGRIRSGACRLSSALEGVVSSELVDIARSTRPFAGLELAQMMSMLAPGLQIGARRERRQVIRGHQNPLGGFSEALQIWSV